MAEDQKLNWDELFRLTVQTLTQGLAVLDAKARILYANDALATMLGCVVSELKGKTFVSFFDEQARRVLEQQIERRQKGYQGLYELEFTNQHGQRFVGLVSAAPLLDKEGRFDCSVAVITDITANKEAQEEIISHHRRLRELSSDLMLAEERERKRLATQLHDRIGHALALAQIKLDRVSDAAVTIGSQEQVKDVMDLIDRTIEDTRTLTFEICPPVLHEVGLVAALNWLADQFAAQHGLAIKFLGEGFDQPLNNELRILLFQVAREVLFNVIKHANAKSVEMKLGTAEELVTLSIADDGVGFDVLAAAERSSREGGYGLMSIRERMSHIGGECRIASAPGEGTNVTIIAPRAFTDHTSQDTPVPVPRDHLVPRDRDLLEFTSVILVDDQQLMRQGLINIIDQEPQIRVLAEAVNGEEAVNLTRRLNPDVIVMDIDMPVMDGLAATRLILDEFPATKVIMLSMYSDWSYVSEALKAGAAGYLLKDCAGDDLVRAISAVKGDLIFLSPSVTNLVVTQLMQAQPRREPESGILTPRETEVLKLIAEGNAVKEIALELDLSPKTVYSFRANILRKLALETDSELTRYALREGLADLGD